MRKIKATVNQAKATVDDYVQVFADMPKSAQREITDAIGVAIGSWISYLLYRRWGAPKWAAWGIVGLATRLYRIENEIKNAS